MILSQKNFFSKISCTRSKLFMFKNQNKQFWTRFSSDSTFRHTLEHRVWAFYMPAVPYMGQIQIKLRIIKPASFESAKFYSKYTYFFSRKCLFHIACTKGLKDQCKEKSIF